MLSNDIAVRLLNVMLFRQEKSSPKIEKRPYSALSFRLTSNAKFYTEDEVTDAPVGSVTFVPEQAVYRRDSEHENLLVFHFSLYNNADKKIQVFLPADTERYRALFMEAYEVWEAREIGYRYRATAIFYRILEELEKDGALHPMPHARFLTEGERYLSTGYANPDLSVADAARCAGVSEAYFRRAFHIQYGVSPKQYLLSLRMQRAMSLLQANMHSQSEVARLTGFRDVKYFRAAFKAYTGRSISEYRQNPDYIAGMRGLAVTKHKEE